MKPDKLRYNYWIGGTMKKSFLLVLILLVPALLFAEITVPDGDPLSAVLSLITQWSVLAPIAKAILVIQILVQGLKKFLPNFQYLELFTLVAGLVYGFLQSISTGMSILNSAIFVLITSGGAILVYDYITKKPLNMLFKIEPKS